MPVLDPKGAKRLGLLSALGLETAVSVVLGLWGGAWLDRQWSLSPIGLLLGVGLGTLTAGWRLRRTLKALEALDQADQDEENSRNQP